MNIRNTALHLFLLTGSVHAFTPSSSMIRQQHQCNHQSSSLGSATLLEEPLLEETEMSQAKTYLDDGFVFGLEGSGLERGRGKVSQVFVDGDSLETKPWQVAAVLTTFLAQAAFATNAVSQMYVKTGGDVMTTGFESAFIATLSWILADLGSGILHWSVDNYGNGRTPIMGNIIAAFQGHHTAPWTITERGFFNNVYKLCVPFGIPTVGAISLLAGPQHPMVSLFFTVFCAMEIMSQEFHKWSHMSKAEVPSFVNWFQENGITVDRKAHALHHTMPFEGKYCIVSGICNEVLDNSGFFRRLEHIVYNLNGVESNAWKLDPELKEKTLRGDYSL